MALLLAAAVTPAAPPGSPAARFDAQEAQYPPWQNGRNNDTPARPGLHRPAVDDMADFHGNLDSPALVLYASGNYFFAMAGLVRAFGEANPAYKGRVFYETLPPGLLLKQMQGGGTITSGNLTFTAKPDVMMAEQRASEAWLKDGRLTAPIVSFATNDLTIMVPAGNPAHIKTLADLVGRSAWSCPTPPLRASPPDPRLPGQSRRREPRASSLRHQGRRRHDL